MQKRISALLLAMVIVIGSVLGGNTLKVKAASATVAMSPELAAEFYLFLYQLTETAMHVGGANKGLDSKEAMETLRDGVIGYYSVSGEKDVDFEIKTTDGRTFKSVSGSAYSNGLGEYTTAEGQTYKLSRDKFTTLLLNGTITLDPDIYNDTDEEPTVNDDDEYVKNMKAMFDAKWEELREIGFKDDSGDPTPSPSPDPEKKPFKNIALVTVGASLVALAGAFVKDLFDGKVEGVDSSLFYENGFSNNIRQSVNGHYIYDLSIISGKSGYTYGLTYTVKDYDVLDHNYGYKILVGVLVTNPNNGLLQLSVYGAPDFGSRPSKQISLLPDAVNAGTSSKYAMYYVLNSESVKTDIPLFSSFDNATEYCLSKSLTGLLNGEAYDFPELTKSVPTVMQPLTGYEFAPGRLRNVNQALADAAAKVQPETGTDTAAATKTYTDTMTDTMTKVAPKTEVNPLPSTTPGTETGDGFKGDSYKRDLKLIFPFCIPFDFIHFIQALSADPVAPCFKIPIKLDSLGIDMVLELDLAWMDPVMEIFRLGELGCFVIILMAATKKMIGW